MEGLFAKLIEVVGKSTRYIAAIALASGILLFLPADWLGKFRVDQIVDDYRSIIGIAFIASLAFVVIDLFVRFWEWVRSKLQSMREKRNAKAEVKAFISELDNSEKFILRQFFKPPGSNTIRLLEQHPGVRGLMYKGILEYVGDFDRDRRYIQAMIAPEIRRLLSLEDLEHKANAKVKPPEVKVN
jgi:hypothetical protein